MAAPLIPIGTLIQSSWTDFLKRWKHTLEYSIRYLVASLVLFGGTLLANTNVSLRWPAMLVSGLIAGVIILHATILLGRLVLLEDRGEVFDRTKEAQGARKLFLPFLWVSILRGLATLGGFVVFVLPGIWLSISLAFSSFLVLEGNLRGTQALSGSLHLVKGRWWPTFWRMLIANAFFGLLYVVALNIIVMVIGLFTGYDTIANFAAVDLTQPDLVALGIRTVLDGIGQALLLPLLLTVNIKLFHSLRSSR
jgi:hypothetical protein